MAYNPIGRFQQPYSFSTERRQGQDYLTRLRRHMEGMETLPAMEKRIGGELGLPRMREQFFGLGDVARGLQSQFTAAPEVIGGTTRESLVTAPQRQRMTMKMQEPIQKALGQVLPAVESAGARVGATEQQLGQRMGLGLEQQQMSMLPFEKGYDLMTQRLAREHTSYTFDMQLELNRLIANMNAGVQLTRDEQQRIHELAMAEKSYKNQLSLSQAGWGQQEKMAKLGYGQEERMGGLGYDWALGEQREAGAQERETARYRHFDLGQGLESLAEQFRFW